FFFSSRRRHTRFSRDWSSDVCSSDLSGKCLAIMGRVAYPIDLDQINHDKWNKLVKGRPYVMINFDIGELEVNAGRESLRYNKHRSEERRVGKECRDEWRQGDCERDMR